MSRPAELLVVGAGPAGLAVASAAADRGLGVELVEASPSVAASWRSHYDRLHLHTTRRLSGAPGRPIPTRAGTWVSRDDFVTYLEGCAQHLTIHFDTRVERLERGPGADTWLSHTSRGELLAKRVVVATGYNHTPHLPNWPGCESFSGELLHSAHYRNPKPYAGRHVLVVGSGNSGAEIAADLVEGGAASVHISIRTPPNIVRRNLGPLANQHLGIAVHRLPVRLVDRIGLVLQRATIGDLSGHGLASPSRGAYTRILEDQQIPLIDVGFVDQLKAARITVVPAVSRFEGAEVICGDRRLRPDAVIAATGYRHGLEPLVGHLGILGPSGRPAVHAPRAHPKAPGVYCIGYTNPIVGNLFEVSRVAKRLAATVAAERTAA